MADPKQTLKGAYRIVTVKVTEDVIEQAERKNSNHCMVADAIKASIPHASSVSVDLATIRFTDPEKRQRYIYLTPYHVQRALIDFDQGVHNQPFNFQLRKAAQVLESGSRRLPDGTKKRPSRANKGVVGASGRKQPTKLGGEAPLVGDLSSKQSRRKAVTAATAATPAGTTKKAKVAVTRAAAEKAAAGRARGEPTSAASNITLAQTNQRRIREFGLKQLRP
jgi:hypothetical protein